MSKSYKNKHIFCINNISWLFIFYFLTSLHQKKNNAFPCDIKVWVLGYVISWQTDIKNSIILFKLSSFCLLFSIVLDDQKSLTPMRFIITTQSLIECHMSCFSEIQINDRKLLRTLLSISQMGSHLTRDTLPYFWWFANNCIISIQNLTS